MRFSSLRRTAVLAMTGIALAGTTACFGSFNLTRKVYGFNKNVSTNKFARELVFLAFNIVPVYGAAGFVDAVVVNTVEFWTGKNPVQMTSRIRLDSATTLQRVAFQKDGARMMTIKAFQFDKLVSSTTLRMEPGASEVAVRTVLADGRRDAKVITMTEDGGATISPDR